MRKTYFDAFLSKSTRGWVSDHDRHIAKVHGDAWALAAPGERAFRENSPKKTQLTSLLMPAMLANEMVNRRATTAGTKAANSSASAMIVIRDLIGGPTPWGKREAQVGWGVSRDYFPQLLAQMRDTLPSNPSAFRTSPWINETHPAPPGTTGQPILRLDYRSTWTYPVHKLRLHEPFLCAFASHAPCVVRPDSW